MLHPQDAARFKITEGAQVTLFTPLGNFPLTLRLSEEMARGLAIVPRLRNTVTEPLVSGGEPMICRIEKV
jgi:NADH-quinone oxidoreductase subunit G